MRDCAASSLAHTAGVSKTYDGVAAYRLRRKADRADTVLLDSLA
jgi:hypothetical protein